MRNFIKILSVFLTALIVCLVVEVYAANNISVMLNGEKIEFGNAQPVVYDGRTLVPVRAVFEKLGWKVNWDNNLVNISSDIKVVTIFVNQDSMMVFDRKTDRSSHIDLDVPAMLINDRTMIPLRAVCETLGAVVSWEESRQMASINYTVENTNQASQNTSSSSSISSGNIASNTDTTNTNANISETSLSSNTSTARVVNTGGRTLAINSVPKKGNQIGAIPEGATVTIYPDKTSGNWYWVSYNGVSGYSYKDYLSVNFSNASSESIASSKPSVSSSSSSNSSYDSKVNAFISDSRWRNGVSWGYNRTPKLSAYGSKGCCAYAADFAKYVFEKGSPKSGSAFKNPSEIRSGDVIHMYYSNGGGHWFVVLYRNGNQLKTAEGNYSDKVNISDSTYTINGNSLYQNSKVVSIGEGYHFQ